VKVLFVAGYVRSGSTLLSLLLGDLNQCFSVGEMAAMVYGPDTSLSDLCMCSRSFQDCDFWQTVWRRAFPDEGQFARDRFCGQLRNEATMRSRFLLGGPSASGLGGVKGDHARQMMRRLYEAVAEVSENETIVDSSKTPTHGFMLKSAGVEDLRVVHLVRNPCAVAFSQSRVKKRTETVSGRRYLPRRNLFRSVLGWTKANIHAERLAKSSPGSVRVRYEDLVSSPDSTLAALGMLTIHPPGAGVAESCRSAPDTGKPVRHDVAGNPGKFEWSGGVEAIVPDQEWKSAMPISVQRMIMILTLPLFHRYGYFSPPGS